MTDATPRASWGSRLGFIFAAAGSAVGLGAIWKFPYIAGKNGGGAFLLTYFACVFTLGVALLLAEIMIGRITQRSATSAFRQLGGGAWPVLGLFSVLCLYLIASFYCVVGGWTVAYTLRAASGPLLEPGQDAGALFSGFIADPVQAIAYTAAFLGITVAIVIGGVEKGIERMSKLLMPALFLLMLLLIARVLTLPGAWDGVRYFLTPDFSKLTPAMVIDALGLAFFSLSLGCGMLIAYGSYLGQDTRLGSSALWVAGLATLACVLAGLMVLPAVFAFGMNPGEGPGLTFITMPVIFAQMPAGGFFATAFFLLLLFAALTSSVSIIEPIVGYLMDDWQWRRTPATLLITAAVLALAIPCALSFGVMQDLHFLGSRTFFESLDYIASSILMPAGGIGVAVLVGWVIWPRIQLEMARDGIVSLQAVFRLICALLAPLIIGAIWLHGL